MKYHSTDPEQWNIGQSTLDVFIFRYAEVLLNYAEAKAELGECTQEVLDQTVNELRDRVEMPHLKVNVGFTDPNWPDYGYEKNHETEHTEGSHSGCRILLHSGMQ